MVKTLMTTLQGTCASELLSLEEESRIRNVAIQIPASDIE
jgi:hypothetical protein